MLDSADVISGLNALAFFGVEIAFQLIAFCTGQLRFLNQFQTACVGILGSAMRGNHSSSPEAQRSIGSAFLQGNEEGGRSPAVDR